MVRVLVLLAILTLPFTLALTIDLRFPLKIYEVALLGAGLACLAQFRIPALHSARPVALPVVAIAGFAFAVLLLHLWLPPSGLSATGFTSRFGPFGDGIAKIMYLLLAVFGFLLIAERTYRDERLVLRCWLVGAFAAALYSWYLLGASFLGLSPILLPGIETPQVIGFRDWLVIRSGTFEEGNFLGLYLLTSTAIALYAGRRVAALFLSASVLASFSTINFAALVLLWAAYIWLGSARMRLSRRLTTIAAGGLALVGVGALLLGTGYLQSVVSAKLVGESTISRLERVGMALSGLRMFFDHPLTGVGVSQYGYYYNTYEYLSLGPLSDFVGQKRIANNVYVELLSELGVIGFVLFAAFLSSVYRHLRGQEMLALRLGFLGILLVWMAFPSYSIMFLWAFWGVIMGASARLTEGGAQTAPTSR